MEGRREVDQGKLVSKFTHALNTLTIPSSQSEQHNLYINLANNFVSKDREIYLKSNKENKRKIESNGLRVSPGEKQRNNNNLYGNIKTEHKFKSFHHSKSVQKCPRVSNLEMCTMDQRRSVDTPTMSQDIYKSYANFLYRNNTEDKRKVGNMTNKQNKHKKQNIRNNSEERTKESAWGRGINNNYSKVSFNHLKKEFKRAYNSNLNKDKDKLLQNTIKSGQNTPIANNNQHKLLSPCNNIDKSCNVDLSCIDELYKPKMRSERGIEEAGVNCMNKRRLSKPKMKKVLNASECIYKVGCNPPFNRHLLPHYPITGRRKSQGDIIDIKNKGGKDKLEEDPTNGYYEEVNNILESIADDLRNEKENLDCFVKEGKCCGGLSSYEDIYCGEKSVGDNVKRGNVRLNKLDKYVNSNNSERGRSKGGECEVGDIDRNMDMDIIYEEESMQSIKGVRENMKYLDRSRSKGIKWDSFHNQIPHNTHSHNMHIDNIDNIDNIESIDNIDIIDNIDNIENTENNQNGKINRRESGGESEEVNRANTLNTVNIDKDRDSISIFPSSPESYPFYGELFTTNTTHTNHPTPHISYSDKQPNLSKSQLHPSPTAHHLNMHLHQYIHLNNPPY